MSVANGGDRAAVEQFLKTLEEMERIVADHVRIGLKRDTVFLLHIPRCDPKGVGTPEPDDAAFHRERLAEAVESVGSLHARLWPDDRESLDRFTELRRAKQPTAELVAAVRTAAERMLLRLGPPAPIPAPSVAPVPIPTAPAGTTGPPAVPAVEAGPPAPPRPEPALWDRPRPTPVMENQFRDLCQVRALRIARPDDPAGDPVITGLRVAYGHCLWHVERLRELCRKARDIPHAVPEDLRDFNGFDWDYNLRRTLEEPGPRDALVRAVARLPQPRRFGPAAAQFVLGLTDRARHMADEPPATVTAELAGSDIDWGAVVHALEAEFREAVALRRTEVAATGTRPIPAGPPVPPAVESSDAATEAREAALACLSSIVPLWEHYERLAEAANPDNARKFCAGEPGADIPPLVAGAVASVAAGGAGVVAAFESALADARRIIPALGDRLVRARADEGLPLRATLAGRSDVSAHALALRLAEAVDDARRSSDIRDALTGENREADPADVFESIGAVLCGGRDRREWSDPRKLEAEIMFEWAAMLRLLRREPTGDGGIARPDDGAGHGGVRPEDDSEWELPHRREAVGDVFGTLTNFRGTHDEMEAAAEAEFRTVGNTTRYQSIRDKMRDHARHCVWFMEGVHRLEEFLSLLPELRRDWPLPSADVRDRALGRLHELTGRPVPILEGMKLGDVVDAARAARPGPIPIGPGDAGSPFVASPAVGQAGTGPSAVAGAVAAAPPPRRARRGRKIAAAIAELVANPSLTNREIADRVGCNPNTLTNNEMFRNTRARLRAEGRSNIPLGRKRDGRTEASGEDRESDEME